MDISREHATDSASIRLRYTTQLQSGGRTQAIDAEICIPVGASQEVREQIIREAELSVKQLAQQIVQRGARPGEDARSQLSHSGPGMPGNSSATIAGRTAGGPGRVHGESAGVAVPRQATNPSFPATRVPIGESMPTTPVSSGEGNPIKLPQFLGAITKYLNISPAEAMKLLNVDSLDGLNYRDAYRQLQALIEQKGPEATFHAPPAPRSAPVVEAPRQIGRALPQRQALTGKSDQGQSALNLTVSPGVETSPVNEQPRAAARGGSLTDISRAPVPIHIGVEVMHDASAQAYKFEEEDEEELGEDEEEFEEEEEEEDYPLPIDREQERASAQLKLERLTGIRGTQAASAERLRVLNTLLDTQISGEQLQKIIQAAWGVPAAKKLKNAQVEELISWAKEDYFVEEAEAMLKLIEGDGE